VSRSWTERIDLFQAVPSASEISKITVPLTSTCISLPYHSREIPSHVNAVVHKVRARRSLFFCSGVHANSKSMTLSPNVADNVCGEMILSPGSSRSCCHRQHIPAVYEVVNTKKFRSENM
jgi:hypothetical protein